MHAVDRRRPDRQHENVSLGRGRRTSRARAKSASRSGMVLQRHGRFCARTVSRWTSRLCRGWRRGSAKSPAYISSIPTAIPGASAWLSATSFPTTVLKSKLPEPRRLEDAQLRARTGTRHRSGVPIRARQSRDRTRRQDPLVESRFETGEAEMCHSLREHGAPPLQVRSPPPARRRARPLLRRGLSQLRRWH